MAHRQPGSRLLGRLNSGERKRAEGQTNAGSSFREGSRTRTG